MSNAPLNGANLRGALDLSSLVRPPAGASPSASAPQGGTGQGAPAIAGTDANFTQVLELSNTVPVIVEFHGAGIQPSLGGLVASFGGRFAYVTVDGEVNPQLAQAFQVREVPTVAAVIGGRPMQLFVGLPAEDEVRAVFEQVLQVAAQNGVTGVVPSQDAEGEAEPVEEPLPPHHQEAYDAIAAGDYATAIREYETAIVENPRDQLAVAGLAQVSLLNRLGGTTADELRSAAASAPDDVQAQLAVADLDVAGGHLDDAFGRLLDLFPTVFGDERTAIRTRLVDYFEIAGAEDPRVIAARRKLTLLLY